MYGFVYFAKITRRDSLYWCLLYQDVIYLLVIISCFTRKKGEWDDSMLFLLSIFISSHSFKTSCGWWM